MFKYYKTVTRYNGSSVYTKQQDSGWRRKPESIWEAMRIIRLKLRPKTLHTERFCDGTHACGVPLSLSEWNQFLLLLRTTLLTQFNDL
jgi:hypothetical protein